MFTYQAHFNIPHRQFWEEERERKRERESEREREREREREGEGRFRLVRKVIVYVGV